MQATMTSGSGADTTTAIGPITATGIRPITAMAIRRITATATTHRDLITAITTHGGITIAGNLGAATVCVVGRSTRASRQKGSNLSSRRRAASTGC